MAQALTGTESRQKSGRRRVGETRALLLQACIELIRADGLTALTTDRVAKAAGISQPGFYNHFKNVDALLEVAVTDVLTEMADRQSRLRREAMQVPSTLAAMLQPAPTRALLERMLEVLLSEPTFADLYLRYRFDPTVLGGAIARVARKVEEEMIADNWALSLVAGTRPEHYDRVALYAEQISALYYRAGEQLLHGRYDREQILESLTSASVVLNQQLVEELVRLQPEWRPVGSD